MLIRDPGRGQVIRVIQILIVPWFHHNRTQNIFSWDGKSIVQYYSQAIGEIFSQLIFFVNIILTVIFNTGLWLAQDSPVNHFQLSRSLIGGIVGITGWHTDTAEAERLCSKTKSLVLKIVCNICSHCESSRDMGHMRMGGRMQLDLVMCGIICHECRWHSAIAAIWPVRVTQAPSIFREMGNYYTIIEI